MNIFIFDDYKTYVNAWITDLPKRGRGEFQKIAKSLRVHPTLISHILRGEKHFNLEQAAEMANHLQLTELETEYFICLVLISRSSTATLKVTLERQRDQIKARAAQLSQRLEKTRLLTSEDQSTFYSAWYYSAIRNMTAIPGYQTPSELKDFFSTLSPALIDKVLRFLVSRNLCRDDSGRYSPGPSVTHLPANSPLISQHHANWRIKAMERHSQLRPDELSYSAPMTLSKKDALLIREKLFKLIEETLATVRPSPSEELRCLNMDWFKVKG